MIDWQDLGAACALWLIMESLLPLLAPQRLRELLLQIVLLRDEQLRRYGLIGLLAGAALLWWVRG